MSQRGKLTGRGRVPDAVVIDEVNIWTDCIGVPKHHITGEYPLCWSAFQVASLYWPLCPECRAPVLISNNVWACADPECVNR